MKLRQLHLWLSLAGAIVVIPGLLWIATSGSRLNDGDAHIALQPLIRIPLGRISDGPFSERFDVPDTRQWAKIRKVWGEPDFVVTAIDEAGRYLICPPIPLRIDLTDRGGSSIPLRRGEPPYGYSAHCSESSLRFQATAGDTLNIKITAAGDRLLPAGDIIVVRYWWNTKDKLVGVYLDDEIDSLARWTFFAGILFLVAGAALALMRRLREHRTV